MKVSTTTVKDCLLLEAKNYPDQRGYFRELFNQGRYGPHGVGSCLQVNCSVSKRNVVRGLHITPFGKLVSCVKGRIFDVAVDLRPGSPTYLKWFGQELSPENGFQLYVPPHCGHGFMALEDETIVVYLQESTYDPTVESSIHWKDPTIAVTWPWAESYVLSPKDEAAPPLAG